MSDLIALQDLGTVLDCYGCGSSNPNGFQFKSYLEGETATLTFTPKSYQCGGASDYVYGGLLASIIDCHSCNLALALHYKEAARTIGSKPRIRGVTAQLNVTFKAPTPITVPFSATARILSKEGKKTWVRTEITSSGILTAWGEVLCVRIADEPLS